MISRPRAQSTPKKSPVNRRLFFIQRLLLPPRCLLCNDRGADELDLCAGCLHDLPWLTHACEQCALPLPPAPGSMFCGSCLRNPPPFSRTLIPFRYQFPANRLIQALKYQRRTPPARLFGELLYDHLIHQPDLQLPDRVIPVPLHPQRERQRGFNQAQAIAHFLCRRLQVPLELEALVRSSNTPPQQGLSAEARRRNLRHAFRVTGSLQGRRVALLDDVMTTGSTFAQLASLCRQAGATDVQCWGVARTPAPGDAGVDAPD